MWFRRRQRGRDPEPAETPGLQEARQAREGAEATLGEVRDLWPDVNELADRMREYTRRNGISRLFDEALGGGHDRDRR
ncbi:DUF7620 family protein [Herbidospora sp. RD11066]